MVKDDDTNRHFVHRSIFIGSSPPIPLVPFQKEPPCLNYQLMKWYLPDWKVGGNRLTQKRRVPMVDRKIAKVAQIGDV
jgi:hypothetical protein